MKIFRIALISVLLAGGLSACSKNPFNVDLKPLQEPTYNFTQSSALLACVGRLVDAKEGSPVDVYISNIPDHTTPSIEGGFLTKNAVMMVTTALDRMNTNRVAIVGEDGGLPGRGQIQILGAFTELNRTIQSNALSGEAAFPGGFELELGGDNNVNHIALDLAISEKNRIVPKTSTSVSIHIIGSRGDTTITFDDGGEFAAVGGFGYTAQEGFHSASRLLVETAVAIMMSRYYGIDVVDCLIENKNPKAPRQKTRYDEPVFVGSRQDYGIVAPATPPPPPRPGEERAPLVINNNAVVNPLQVMPATVSPVIRGSVVPTPVPAYQGMYNYTGTDPVAGRNNGAPPFYAVPSESGVRYLPLAPNEYRTDPRAAFNDRSAAEANVNPSAPPPLTIVPSWK